MGLQRLSVYTSTALKLGLGNVARVLSYRALKRGGVYKWLLPRASPAPLGFAPRGGAAAPQGRTLAGNPAGIIECDNLLAGCATFFQAHTKMVGNPPDWFLNPFQGFSHGARTKHWSEIPDFDAEAGDIKIIWEMSRFAWAPVFAKAWRTTGDVRYLAALEEWIEHWWQNNPPNVGPNWKCGQETAIRLINVLLATAVVPTDLNSSALSTFVEAHCGRIARTISYAIGQDNNHGTSEAAGLFIGGAWLAKYGSSDVRRKGGRWTEQGRKVLERLVNRLVQDDGSFSQHSLTYHRVLLDTLSVAEVFRRVFHQPAFGERFYEKASAGVKWFGAMIDPISGDAPNLGANDGSLPYRLDQSGYRDFRPSLQLSAVLFLGRPALAAGPWDEALSWLGVKPNGEPWCPAGSTVLAKGGYVVLRQPGDSGTWAAIRAPTGRFRPSQADALHVDLWHQGRNVLRDGGTYSYAGDETGEVLASVAGHNAVQFDDHDQMSRLGRFLYGNWIRVRGDAVIGCQGGHQSWSGYYTDAWGARHERCITLGNKTMTVIDRLSGFSNSAVLRWRLAPATWVLNDVDCRSALGSITLGSDVPVQRLALVQGWESRHYLERTQLPVLELEIKEAPATVKTVFVLP